MRELAGTDRSKPVEAWPPVIAAITLLVAIVGISARATVRSSVPPAPPPIAATPRPSETARIATISEGDVWLYDVASNATQRLTFDGQAQRKTQPRIESATSVTYLADRTPDLTGLWRRAVTLNATPELILTGRPILAYDSRGREIAYLTRDADGRSVLRLWDGSASRALRTFGEDTNRDFDETDDLHVQWSPDGTRLLVTNTMQERDTIFVVRRDGSDAAASRAGTYARWWGNNRIVFSHDGLQSWRLGSDPSRLDARDARHISVSPDGRSVAADDGRDTFIWSPNGRRTLGPGRSPIWLTSVAVVVSRATEGTQRLDFTSPGRLLTLPSTVDASS